MGEPQSILNPLTRAAIFLVAAIEPDGEDVVRDVLADVPGLARSVGFRLPGTDLSCVVGIGSAAWDRLFAGPKPAGLHEFVPLAGERHSAPATPGDVLFHLKAESLDACFELGAKIAERLGSAVTIVDETAGFRYFEQRDLLGFVDGTENPTGVPAVDAALIGAEDPEFAGGSYVIVQKYLHAMTDWKSLSTGEQERVVGRTKLDDFELSDEDKPADSHVALTSVTDADGTERKILRANMPFGSIKGGEFGTYFIGYAATPDVTELMLQRMFLGADGASHDRILDFSTAVTGSLFFVPSAAFLDDLPPPPEADDLGMQPATPDDDTRNRDGSLGIGSLKGSQS